MFDYQGYTDTFLRRRCEKLRVFKGLCNRYYGQTEMYSIGRYYRQQCGYPAALPLFVFSQHGANQTYIMPVERENDAEAMLVWNTARQREYQKVSDKPCYVVTCPYVTHRRRQGIVQAPEARGSLIFPSHSLKEAEAVYDIDKYAEEILALPPEFHPVAVCLFVADVRRGVHRRYQEKGLAVYSAGDIQDAHFGDRLYDILRHFRYAMSNAFGSYAYYSVEMGIPFSLWGEQAAHVSHTPAPGVPATPPPPPPSVIHAQELLGGEKLFSGIHTEIRSEQRDFVEFSMGLGQGLSDEELGRILWEAYRKRGRPLADTLTSTRLRLKHGFQKLVYGID